MSSTHIQTHIQHNVLLIYLRAIKLLILAPKILVQTPGGFSEFLVGVNGSFSSNPDPISDQNI